MEPSALPLENAENLTLSGDLQRLSAECARAEEELSPVETTCVTVNDSTFEFVGSEMCIVDDEYAIASDSWTMSELQVVCESRAAAERNVDSGYPEWATQ